MAAPLQTYSDSRLYGTSLTYPYNRLSQLSFEHIDVRHPATNPFYEQALFLLLSIARQICSSCFSLPYLIGKCIQIIHYHTLPSHPAAVKVHGVGLPLLNPHPKTSIPCSFGYIVTDATTSLHMLRYSIDPSSTTMGTAIEFRRWYYPGHIVKAFFHPTISKSQFAVMSTASLQKLQLDVKRKWKHLTTKEKDCAFRDLFLKNGYQALQIEGEDKFYLYDSTYICSLAYRYQS